MRRRADGFTLLELLVAMSILAIVSLMAVQMLSGAIFQRDVLARVDAQAEDLGRALALLRHDLEAVAPMPLGGDGGGEGDGAGLPVAVRGDGFSLMRGGVAALPGEVSGGFARVAWRLNVEGALTRQMTLGADQEGAEIVVLRGVTGLRLAALGGVLPSPEAPGELPAGFEVTLNHARYGELRLVVAR